MIMIQAWRRSYWHYDVMANVLNAVSHDWSSGASGSIDWNEAEGDPVYFTAATDLSYSEWQEDRPCSERQLDTI